MGRLGEEADEARLANNVLLIVEAGWQVHGMHPVLWMFENFQGKKLKVRFYDPKHFVAGNTVITNTVR